MALFVTSLSVATGMLSPYQHRLTETIPEIILNSTTTVYYGSGEKPIYYSILKMLLKFWMFCAGRVASLAKCLLFVMAFTVSTVGDQFVLRIQSICSIDEVGAI